MFNQHFPLLPEKKEPKHEVYRQVRSAFAPFSSQKTLQMFKKGLGISDIAKRRGIKEGTVWEHLALLIEYNQLKLAKVLAAEKIRKILSHLKDGTEKVSQVKSRIADSAITYNELACALAHVRKEQRKKSS